MSIFDPASFLDESITEALDTVRVPVPVGEYFAISGEAEIIPWASRDGTKSGQKLRLPFFIEDASLSAITGYARSRVSLDVMLDLTPEQRIDTAKGKNVRLGQLREAFSLNAPGQPFSMRMLAGQPGKILVKHRTSADGKDTYPEVDAVAHV